MGGPVRNPDTGGRSLADILREAGIENPSRSGRRRRWDDVDDAGIRQRRAEADDRSADGPYGRRSSDLPLDRPAATGSGSPRERDLPRGGGPGRDVRAGERDRGPADRPVAGDRDLRRARDARSGRGRTTGPVDPVGREVPPSPERAPADGRREPAGGLRRDTGPTRGARPGRSRDSGDAAGRDGRDQRGGRAARDRAERPAAEDPSSTAAIPGLRPSRTPSVPAAPGAAAAAAAPEPAREPEHRRAGRRSRSTGLEPAPLTGPIPALQADEAAEPAEPAEHLEAGPRALSWLRFAGELVIAAAAGVGIYFAFTVLWQTLPHVAVVVAPLAVTGLVTGVSVWRQRFGHAQVGPRLLAVLVFAGTLLTVLPAAGLITSQ